MEYLDPIVPQIMDLFSTGEEAAQYLREKELAANAFLLDDLEALCGTIASALDSLLEKIPYQNKLQELGQNTQPCLRFVRESMAAGDFKKAEIQFVCGFMTIYCFWKQYAGFFLCHAFDEEHLQAWHEKEACRFRQIASYAKKDEDRPCKYDFSIVVLYYNQKKITQECIDAINQYTAGHSYELITFNNGSDEETTQWGEALPHQKKIVFPVNIGSSAAGNLILSMAYLYAEGKYIMMFSNDVIATEGYAKSLYRCMESDTRIALAVPITNSLSNLQTIPVPYKNNDLAKMQQFARKYNTCDPKKWAERARLFQMMGCYRIDALKQLGLAFSPFFCYDMFADDDHSVSLRRMGYMQILCKDVFVHHYGSATLGAGQYEVMEKGRAQFYHKHGVDAWLSLGMDCYAAGSMISTPPKDGVCILGINPKFGESLLELKNKLKEAGCTNIIVDALTEDKRYLADMDALFDRAGMLEEAGKVCSGRLYHYVLVEGSLEQCINPVSVLETARSHLADEGYVIVKYKNSRSQPMLNHVLIDMSLEEDNWRFDPVQMPTVNFLSQDTFMRLIQHTRLQLKQAIRLKNTQLAGQADAILSAVKTNMNNYKTREQLQTEAFMCFLEKGKEG